MKLNKDGFISIEIIIVAGIILIAGVFCIHQFSSQGRESSIKANGVVTDEMDYAKGVVLSLNCPDYPLGSKIYKGTIYYPNGTILIEAVNYNQLGWQKYKDRTIYCERVNGNNRWVAY